MSKVYAVSSGDYSDYRVNAVFSTEEKARQFIVLVTGQAFDANSQYNIETYDLDPYLDAVADGYRVFYVRMRRDGEVLFVEQQENYAFCSEVGEIHYIGMRQELTGRVLAQSKEHAVKIVNEKRTQQIATNQI